MVERAIAPAGRGGAWLCFQGPAGRAQGCAFGSVPLLLGVTGGGRHLPVSIREQNQVPPAVQFQSAPLTFQSAEHHMTHTLLASSLRSHLSFHLAGGHSGQAHSSSLDPDVRGSRLSASPGPSLLWSLQSSVAAAWLPGCGLLGQQGLSLG